MNRHGTGRRYSREVALDDTGWGVRAFVGALVVGIFGLIIDGLTLSVVGVGVVTITILVVCIVLTLTGVGWVVWFTLTGTPTAGASDTEITKTTGEPEWRNQWLDQHNTNFPP